MDGYYDRKGDRQKRSDVTDGGKKNGPDVSRLCVLNSLRAPHSVHAL